MLDAETVRELLHYDPETGVFTWRERDRRWFKSHKGWRVWNGKYAGRVAGCITEDARGYRRREIGIFATKWLAHRLAYLYVNGAVLPIEFDIDHIDRDATNNRWSNLRVATRLQNRKNASMRSGNKSGVNGVNWDKARSKWAVYVSVNGATKALGRFSSLLDAVATRFRAEREMGYSDGHGSKRIYSSEVVK